MKQNFVVSNMYEAWLPESRNLFALDPVIIHVLKKEGKYSGYESVSSAIPRRKIRDEFFEDHEYVDEKYNKHLSVLLKRLEEIHGAGYEENFWKKSISLSFLRHVSLCYDLFKLCEEYFDIEKHDCRILDPNSYQTPQDFDLHRQLLQNTNIGREQLFSIYCNLFYPGEFSTWEPTLFSSGTPVVSDSASIFARVFKRRKLNLLAKAISRKFLLLRSPRVGIIESYFSVENLDKLIFRSRGRVQPILLPKIPDLLSYPNWDARGKLGREGRDFDRFDKFVFTSLKYVMPKMFVENFVDTLKLLKVHLDKYDKLNWVVSEAWIGHACCSMSLAILRHRDIKHIYNEHNYLAHPFVGNNLKYLAPLVDEFVSIGWKTNSLPNFICGASLFQWVEKEVSVTKQHQILLILGLPLAYAPEVNASYGDSGAYRAMQYFIQNKKLLDCLGEDTLKSMYVRSYPKRKIRDWLTWDQSYELSEYWEKVKHYDDFSDSGRLLMQQSRLVIINYLSTSYLESLIADIPTVFIWNKDTNTFLDEYLNIFDGLMDVGICQTDPEAAASFINSIKDNPEAWWAREEVREARAEFISKHIGDPETMIRHLLNKAGNVSTH